MKVTTIRRLSRGVAAMAFAAVLALPVVAAEPPAASLLAWSGVVCIVVGLAAGLRGAIDAGLLLLLVRYAAVLAFTSAVDPLAWAKAGATVALIDLAHGSFEAVLPGDPGRWRWGRTFVTAAIAAAAAGVVVLGTAAAPGGLVVRIVAFGALVASLALLVLLLRRGAEPPVPSNR